MHVATLKGPNETTECLTPSMLSGMYENVEAMCLMIFCEDGLI